MLLDELLKNKREFERETKLSIEDFLVDPKSNSTLNVRWIGNFFFAFILFNNF